VAGAYAEAWQQSKREARRVVEAAAGLCAASGGTVRRIVREGHPISELTALVGEVGADLIVVGPHGRGRLQSIMLGSVSQSLLHAMPTSILVARDPVRAPERVLLAFDGSSPSLSAARFLASFPLPAGVRMDVLAVVDGLHSRYAEHGAADLRDLVALERRGAAEVIQQAVELLAAAGRTAQPAIRDGDPKREILAAAGELESDLIVMGARGVGGFRGMILGSVSRAVSKAAPCSTLVVDHRAGANEQGGS
jgi:nucleotide-binding universal stress UspA family protein